jgi:hypothetical protein
MTTLNAAFRTLLTALLVAILNLVPLPIALQGLVLNQAMAQTPDPRVEASNKEVNLTITAPDDDAVRGNPVNLRHYQVVLFELTQDAEELSTCPTSLVGPAVKPVVISMASLPQNSLVLRTDKVYLIGSYQRVEDYNDQPLWTLTPKSCRKLTPELPGPDLSYKPLITWVPPLKNFSAQATLDLLPLKPDYYLVRQEGVECERELTSDTTGYAAATALHERNTDLKRTLPGGNSVLGVYFREQVMLPADGGAQTQGLRYNLVRGTCQAYVVNDYDLVFTYRPKLPKRVLAPAVPTPTPEAIVVETPDLDLDVAPPTPVKGQYLLGVGPTVGFQGTDSTAGLSAIGSLTVDHLVLATRLGVDFVPIPSEPVSARLDLAMAMGYGHSYALSHHPLAPLPTLSWDLLLAGGLGSFQAECGPREFPLADDNIVLTCGHRGEFPLRVVGPWIGPETSGRLLWPGKLRSEDDKPHSVGLNVSVGLEVYPVSNVWPQYIQVQGGRTTTVHTDQGDRKVIFWFEDDWMVWAVPTVSASLVLGW